MNAMGRIEGGRGCNTKMVDEEGEVWIQGEG